MTTSARVNPRKLLRIAGLAVYAAFALGGCCTVRAEITFPDPPPAFNPDGSERMWITSDGNYLIVEPSWFDDVSAYVQQVEEQRKRYEASKK